MKTQIKLLSTVTIAAGLLFSAAIAKADVLQYSVNLSGPNESPANASPGIGSGTVFIDTTLNTMTLNVVFSGLVGTVTASHIHGATAVAGVGTAGVATTTPTFAGFPSGVTAGSYVNVLDLTLTSSYNPAYITAHGGTTAQAEIDFLAAIAAGKTYWNIHTSAFPGGEIRGFLTPVPEPTSLALLGFGGSALVLAVRRRKA